MIFRYVRIITGLLFVCLCVIVLVFIADIRSIDHLAGFFRTPGGYEWNIAEQVHWHEFELIEDTTKALILVKDNKVVFEWYKNNNPGRLYGVASLSKALVGSMSLALALHDGLVSMDDPAWHYIRHWEQDPIKKRITIRHLATHSSGMPHRPEKADNKSGWEYAFWNRKPELFSLVLSDAPLECMPGECYKYSGPAYAALAYALTNRLRTTDQPDARAQLEERLMQPLGIPDSDWSISYGESYEVDGMTVYASWGGASFTARAAARIGQLMLSGGKWNGKELINAASVKQVISYMNTPLPDNSTVKPLPAAGWWSNANNAWPSLPTDAYVGAGAGHEIMLIVPSMGIVLVRYGRKLGNDLWAGDYWNALERKLFRPLMKTVTNQHSTD
jgi:CubicO group peptidase (beta-lactamase class C family)